MHARVCVWRLCIRNHAAIVSLGINVSPFPKHSSPTNMLFPWRALPSTFFLPFICYICFLSCSSHRLNNNGGVYLTITSKGGLSLMYSFRVVATGGALRVPVLNAQDSTLPSLSMHHCCWFPCGGPCDSLYLHSETNSCHSNMAIVFLSPFWVEAFVYLRLSKTRVLSACSLVLLLLPRSHFQQLTTVLAARVSQPLKMFPEIAQINT